MGRSCKDDDVGGTELGAAQAEELSRDGGSRRILSQAVDAHRRLKAQRADRTRHELKPVL